MTKREQFIQWISDAHAMEMGLVTALEKQIADAQEQPKLLAALANHLIETKTHAAKMERILTQLGTSPSLVKEGISKTSMFAVDLVSSVAQDTPVKNAIIAFAAENFEIACYTSLIAAAKLLNEAGIAIECEAILAQEKAMAAFLEGELKEINAAYLAELPEDDKVCV